MGTNGAGGQGGSGVVIVRYKGASLGSVGGTVTTGSGSAAGYTIHTFTTSGTTTGTGAFNLSGVDMNARLGVTLTGTISGTGGLTFAGPGRLTLAANNTFTGDTRVTSGTLVATFGALQYSTLDMNSSDSGAVTFSQNALLGGLKGSRNLDNGGRYLYVGGNNSSTTFLGNLSGGGGLSKEGTGTLTLSGSNSFTGDTSVEGGTLLLNSDQALAQRVNLFVNTSGTLDRTGHSLTLVNCVMYGTVLNTGGGGVLSAETLTGAGLIDGDVAVAVAISQDPGSSDAGTHTFTGNLTEAPGALVRWQLFDNSVSLPGVNYDQIVLPSTANMVFSGSNVLSLLFDGSEGCKVDWSNSFWDVNRAWTVFDLASGVTTGFGNLSLGGSLRDSVGNTLLPTRGAFSLSQVGQDVVLQYTAVPEPATSAMALAGLACGCYLVRRRRKPSLMLSALGAGEGPRCITGTLTRPAATLSRWERDAGSMPRIGRANSLSATRAPSDTRVARTSWSGRCRVYSMIIPGRNHVYEPSLQFCKRRGGSPVAGGVEACRSGSRGGAPQRVAKP